MARFDRGKWREIAVSLGKMVKSMGSMGFTRENCGLTMLNQGKCGFYMVFTRETGEFSNRNGTPDG